ncbi:MAG: hypothetical protein EHM58_08210 [Ignavibacteriae bacterium]|nr:MAG: hypothetical protein EHM58_08210 [Ignavibacteriota bacterium]
MNESDKYRSFDDVKCLWMKCGAIDYKICDKNFACENCDFDKQMLSGLKIKGDVQEKIESMFGIGQHTVSFTHPCYHFCSGLMVRNFIANNYYLGIEPYIAKFIDKYSLLKYSNSNDNVKKGEPVLNISNGWGEVNVLSPFSFNFVEKLEMNNVFSRDLHWFAIIEAERFEILGNSINKRVYFDKLYETKLSLLNLMKTSEEAGVTMYDGGAIIENWSDILGKSTYKNLLEKLFSGDSI